MVFFFRSLSQMNHIWLWTWYRVACQWTTALCIKCRSIWKQLMDIYHQSRSRLYARESHAITCTALVLMHHFITRLTKVYKIRSHAYFFASWKYNSCGQKLGCKHFWLIWFIHLVKLFDKHSLGYIKVGKSRKKCIICKLECSFAF